MGHSDLTDGTWVWPEGLAHYVEVHQLTLPKEFVEIALANGGVVPALADHVRALSHAQRMDSVDPTFWNDWYRRVAGEAD